MKIFDALRTGAKTANGKWEAVIAAGMAICVFCLCFAGAIFAHVQEEKDRPSELSLSTLKSAKIADSLLAQVAGIEGVAAVSAAVELPVTLKTGSYSAGLTITGLKPGYIDNKFATGGSLPENSAMPYIVLNEAACKSFSDGKTGFGGTEKEKDIDWLSAGFVLETEDGQSAAVKICGIIPDETEDEAPLAFMDIKKAQELLRTGGQTADPVLAYARTQNAGYAKSAAEAISNLGLSVTNENEELQARWDSSLMEADYLIALAVLALALTGCIIRLGMKMSVPAGRERRSGWTGSKSGLYKALVMRTMFVVVCGIAAGIVVALFTPMFILPEDIAASSFALYAPWWTVLASAGICLAGGILSV
jgi:hypothetical protein